MGNGAKTIIIYFTVVVVGLFFFFEGLVQARTFLAPVSVAALLAMIVLPVCKWLERKGLERGWASFFSVLVILLFFGVVGWVISAQVRNLARDWPQMRQKIEPKINQIGQFIEDKTGVSLPAQNNAAQRQGWPAGESRQEQSPGSGQQGKQEGSYLFGTGFQVSGSSMLYRAGGYAAELLGALGTLLLVFVYIFFFLLYRAKFKKTIIKMVSEEKRGKAREIIDQSAHISQNYLFGRLILIVILAVFYSIGLSVSGIPHAVLISILAALITLIPIVGNIIGYSLSIGMAILSGDVLTGVIGVTVTFAVAQFIEEYFLEPYIVGEQVNLNPVITIIVVFLGGAIWGLVGMLVAIPALGILKVVCDNVPVLNPLGYLFGNERAGGDQESGNMLKKAKRWASDKFDSKQDS